LLPLKKSTLAEPNPGLDDPVVISIRKSMGELGVVLKVGVTKFWSIVVRGNVMLKGANMPLWLNTVRLFIEISLELLRKPIPINSKIPKPASPG